MYLRTPKRYRAGRQRHLRLISRRTITALLLIPVVGWVGWMVWANQERVRSEVVPVIGDQIENITSRVQTQVAPHPTPTPTPDVNVAQAGCISAYQQGNLREAVVQCAILADANPNEVSVHYKVAHLMIITSNFGKDAKRLDDALTYAQRTINANPEAPDGWAITAMALDWKGDYGAALASALHAKSLDPNYAPTYAFLGEIYRDLGQPEIAESYLDQAIALDTSGIAVADAFRNKGLLYSDQGRREEAIENYKRALQNAPTHSYIAIEMATNYVALDEIDTAIQLLVSALESTPNDPSLLWALGFIHVRNGQPEKGYEYYRRCLENDPDNWPCLSYLGGLQLNDGDYVTAITNLQRAIELGSTDPDDFLELGRALSAQGRCTEAIPYLQQGYQMVTDSGDSAKQERFANALQQCNVPVGPPAPTPTPAVEEAGTPEPTVIP